VSTYVIIIERSELGSYGAWSPDLPGCVAAANHQDECLQLMREAIEFHLEGMRAHGETIPEPTTVAATKASGGQLCRVIHAGTASPAGS